MGVEPTREWGHNPPLHRLASSPNVELLGGVEPPAPRLRGECSAGLSYSSEFLDGNGRHGLVRSRNDGGTVEGFRIYATPREGVLREQVGCGLVSVALPAELHPLSRTAGFEPATHRLGEVSAPYTTEDELVGMTGFEPATSCAQGMRPAKLGYIPEVVRAVGVEPTKPSASGWWICQFSYARMSWWIGEESNLRCFWCVRFTAGWDRHYPYRSTKMAGGNKAATAMLAIIG